jgi:hypothetical protein
MSRKEMVDAPRAKREPKVLFITGYAEHAASAMATLSQGMLALTAGMGGKRTLALLRVARCSEPLLGQ